MPKKIRRRAAVFHKKKVTFSKVLIGILVVVGCAGVLAGGYFTAKFSVEGWPFGGSAVSGGSAAPESVDSKPESQTPSSDPASVPPEPTPQTGGLRAFYAPLSLLRDQAALAARYFFHSFQSRLNRMKRLMARNDAQTGRVKNTEKS